MSSGGGGGGGGGTNINYVRYAPYVEERHSNFLSKIYTKREAVIDASPFSDYDDVLVDEAFFGSGYVIANFPSLYDMFGKFLAGLDIEALWDQVYEGTVNSPQVDALISAEAALIDEEIENNSLPRFQYGMRDINAVLTSTFVIGKAGIEDTKTKALAKYAAELRYKLIDTAQNRWSNHLTWNQNVIRTYAEMMKLYYATKMDVNEANYSASAKNLLWPFTVLDYERAALGALQGATTSTSDVAGASSAQKAIGGALTGAAAGAMIGSAVPGIGTAVGAAAGGVLGLASGFL